MEFELGLKLTHKRDDDPTSMADFQITKDPSSPFFLSKETDSKFILTGYLKGFRKESIDIEINEAGNRIAISGKKPVQEMVLRGWIMQKKEVEIRAFRKVFRIPEGVILDKTRAKFNEETSNLTINMPKSVKGYCGVVIEEVKEEEVDRGRPQQSLNVVDRIEEPELKPVVAGEDPEKGTDKEALKEDIVEEKVVGKQESSQVVDPAIDRGNHETTEAAAAEEIPEKKKPEKAQEKVRGGESRAAENAAKAESERLEETSWKESKGHQIAEKSQGRTGTASSKPETTKVTEPLLAEETRREKLPEEKTLEPGIERHVSGFEVANSVESGDDQVSLSTNHVEEKHTTTSKDLQVESKMLEELQKQEPSTEVEGLTKPEEPRQVSESEETQGNEINASQELEKQKGGNEDAAQLKKHVSKENKLCPPLVVAGSALLVSLIVLVFQLIRAKRR